MAGISWVERSAASGSPPEASFEEALGFAERSYELRASKKAALLAAQCYDKLNQRAEKKEWSQRCLDLESAGEADAEIDRKAKALM